jgi:hypothetical protein
MFGGIRKTVVAGVVVLTLVCIVAGSRSATAARPSLAPVQERVQRYSIADRERRLADKALTAGSPVMIHCREWNGIRPHPIHNESHDWCRNQAREYRHAGGFACLILPMRVEGWGLLAGDNSVDRIAAARSQAGNLV